MDSSVTEIILDTETTGLDPADGHRIVEIGCVELCNHIPTGRTLQLYLNPERDVPAEAAAVHGLTSAFLKDKPVFAQVYTQFIEFIADSRIVAHNAEFDMKFINAELKSVGEPAIAWSRVTDTAGLARKKFPGSPVNLDALCRRFNISIENRALHGALLDSQLLAEVYLELMGGRQRGFLDAQSIKEQKTTHRATQVKKNRAPRVFKPGKDEIAAHAAMIGNLKNPIWKKISTS
jgi:DNA polymerase-3 subunit epsilon